MLRWNWKSALFSSVIRGTIFFITNVSAGPDAALGALATEFVFGATVCGFYGFLVQTFTRVEPAWQAAITLALVLPAIIHGLEFGLHWMRGTPNLDLSILVSISYTAMAMLFNLYAMRRGVMVVGDRQRPFLDDMKMIPSIAVGFAVAAALLVRRAAGEIWNLLAFSNRGEPL